MSFSDKAEISELAQLLAGITATVAKKSPLAAPSAPTNTGKAMPAAAIPGALSAAPKAAVISNLPNTAATPTLRTFVPNAATKPEPVMPSLAPTIGDPYRNNAVQARRAGLQSNLAEYARPLNPDDYKPRWWQRLGAAAATFGAAMNHNPNAIEIGNELLNQNLTRAEYRRQQGMKGAKEELEQFDDGEKLHREQQDELMRLQEFALRQAESESRIGKNRAMMEKYENTVQPERVDEYGQWWGHRLGDPDGPEIKAAPPRGWRPPQEKQDLNPEHIVLSSIPAGPKRVAEARRILAARRARRNNDEGPKETPATRLRRQQDINKAGDERRAALNALEQGDSRKGLIGYRQERQSIQRSKFIPGTKTPIAEDVRQKMLDDLDEQHRQNKQQVEDAYATKLSSYGVPHERVIYNRDGTYTREGGDNQASAQTQSARSTSGYKIGDVVTIKGRKIKITKLFADGTFDGQETR